MYRVVGFLEYGVALRYFDALLQQLTPEELKAVDAIVGDRPEFAVHTNIAKRVQAAPSSLVPVSASTSSEQSKTERRGLAWVMALARVEVGGVLATFTGHPSPFEAVGPSKYEMSAYQQLLLDGAQTHYWALANDPEARRVAKIVPDTQTLAYIRRLNVAQHFLVAAIQSQSNNLNPLQIAEAMKQKQQLEGLRGVYSSNVAEYIALMNSRQEVTTKKLRPEQTSVEACFAQLRYEPKALARGAAQSTTTGGP